MWGPENIWLIGFCAAMTCICSLMYAIGGTDMEGNFGGQKWVRRFLGSALLAIAAVVAAVVVAAWDWRYLLMYPALAIGFSLGYGGTDNNWIKALKRTWCALGILSACFIGLWITGFTGSGNLVMVLATVTGLTSVALGVFNPFKNAPLEQYLICQVLTLYVPFWCFIK